MQPITYCTYFSYLQITGTGHGIGRELALYYTAHYSTVICVDINEKTNEDTVKSAKRLNKGAVFSYTYVLYKKILFLNHIV